MPWNEPRSFCYDMWSLYTYHEKLINYSQKIHITIAILYILYVFSEIGIIQWWITTDNPVLEFTFLQPMECWTSWSCRLGKKEEEAFYKLFFSHFLWCTSFFGNLSPIWLKAESMDERQQHCRYFLFFETSYICR